MNERLTSMGFAPIHLKYPRTARSVAISDPAWNALRDIAAAHGYSRGSEGSASNLMEAIGLGLFRIVPRWEAQ